MNLELLEGGLAQMAVALDDGQIAKICAYVAAIEKWNPVYGLVGANGDELIIKHILDSLAPLPLIDACARDCLRSRLASAPETMDEPVTLADLGTGAGLPGIPLAIAREQFSVHLVDRMTRRIQFLACMQEELPLPNAEIIEEQVEHAKGCYNLITFRAFRPFERKLFKRVFALCDRNGFVIAYKGRHDKAEAELSEIAGLYSEATVHPLKVPYLDDERCIVLLKPIAR